ncbi:MAG: hypothetical protein LUF30_08520, partial [Lachnospiraceae bacterium]|nr:hypothetical protein [Lachnospiraceae bacterium]
EAGQAGEGVDATSNIYATAGVGGRISDNLEGYTAVASGDSITYAFAPNDAYRVKNVLVDGESIGAADSYTFEDITAPQTINVTFTKSAGA